MLITGAIIVPHPPLILPAVGRGQERGIQATVDAYREAARRVAQWKPEALVIASPHTILYADYFHIAPGKGAKGDMRAFGAKDSAFEAAYDEALRAELVRRAQAVGLHAGTLGEREPALDHGVCIPLYFLREAGIGCPILRMGLSGFSPLEHYKLGKCVQEAAEALGKRVAFIASGDLSHKLKADGPYGFAPEGPALDGALCAAMETGDFLRFLNMDAGLCERGAECGLRGFQIMAGFLDGYAVVPELLSYEGPFGVGYAVAVFEARGKDESRRFDGLYAAAEAERLLQKREAEDAWVRLARLSLEHYVKTGGKGLDALPEGLPAAMTERAAGTFVSIHAHGRLRGCMGTTAPTCASVAEEIVRNAVCAGTEDPRFAPVEAHELAGLEYKVDVLGEAEAIASPAELDVKRYGVIVSCGRRRGLLLPDLDGVDTVEEQVAIARQKGGIRPEEKYSLARFEVVRHT